MKRVFLVFTMAGLIGCGGGGDGGGTSPSSSTPTTTPQISSSSSTPSSSPTSSVQPGSSSLEASSSSIQSSANPVVINPLPEGTGTMSTRFVLGGTYKINEDTGVVVPNEKTLEGYYLAADIDPDGYVIAVSASSTNVDQIDLLAGTAKTLFNAPEKLSAISVSSDGTIVAVSLDEEFSKKYIYRFNSSGEQLSKVSSQDVNPGGIDFASNGDLYGIDLSGTWKINPETGRSTLVHYFEPMGQGDIDISESGSLRVINNGKLQIYDVESGDLEKSVTLQFDYFPFSPVVHR